MKWGTTKMQLSSDNLNIESNVRKTLGIASQWELWLGKVSLKVVMSLWCSSVFMTISSATWGT